MPLPRNVCNVTSKPILRGGFDKFESLWCIDLDEFRQLQDRDVIVLNPVQAG